MSSYGGDPIDGAEFFALLRSSYEFCAALGRAVLAAGRLESELKRYIMSRSGDDKLVQATLGRLIHYAEQHEMLVAYLPVLMTLKIQLNYMAHDIHALLSGLIEETILAVSDLVDSDVIYFTEKAQETADNLDGLADLIARDNH